MTMSAKQRFELSPQALGALPIVSHFLDRLGIEAMLERHLPDGDARVLMAVARTIRVLVVNLCVEREPLYGIAEWAARFDPAALCLEPNEVALLCDDRVGTVGEVIASAPALRRRRLPALRAPFVEPRTPVAHAPPIGW
jgi:hypothetical protein